MQNYYTSILLGQGQTSHFVHRVTKEAIFGHVRSDKLELGGVHIGTVEGAVDIIVNVGRPWLWEIANDWFLFIAAWTVVATFVGVVAKLLRNRTARRPVRPTRLRSVVLVSLTSLRFTWHGHFAVTIVCRYSLNWDAGGVKLPESRVATASQGVLELCHQIFWKNWVNGCQGILIDLSIRPNQENIFSTPSTSDFSSTPQTNLI